MYLDLDLHFSDGVSEAFYAPVRSGPPRILVSTVLINRLLVP
jgi:histone deacetylase 8